MGYVPLIPFHYYKLHLETRPITRHRYGVVIFTVARSS